MLIERLKSGTLTFAALAGALTFVACSAGPSADATDPLSPNQLTSGAQLGVSVTATAAGHSADGDSVFVDIANAGATAVYLPRCGSGPLLLSQQFLNGVWTGGVQNFLCPVPTSPGPVRIEPGARIRILRSFGASGRFRFLVTASATADLADPVTITSNAIDVPDIKPTPADVTVSATLGGRGASGDSVFVDIANVGASPVFLSRCGAEALVVGQQFVNGVWLGGVESFSCLTSTEPGPITLAPNAHLRVLRFFGTAGRFRFITGVANRSDLSDLAWFTSNPVDVP